MEMKRGLAMNARTIGAGGEGKETIILAHGYGADQSVWDKVLPSLAQSYRVLVFDWCFDKYKYKEPNKKDCEGGQNQYHLWSSSSYGEFADDLIGLVEEMKINESGGGGGLVFVGHSMSGMIGCIASIKRPRLFNKLVLVGASPRYINSEDYQGGFEEAQVEQLLARLESNYQEWASGFAAMVVGPNDQSSVDKYEKCLMRMKPETALEVAKLVFLCDERGLLGKVTTPCTIIQTQNDAAVPNSVSKYIKDNIINVTADVQLIHTDGHFPQLTAHLQFLHVLLHKALSTGTL